MHSLQSMICCLCRPAPWCTCSGPTSNGAISNASDISTTAHCFQLMVDDTAEHVGPPSACSSLYSGELLLTYRELGPMYPRNILPRGLILTSWKSSRIMSLPEQLRLHILGHPFGRVSQYSQVVIPTCQHGPAERSVHS